MANFNYNTGNETVDCMGQINFSGNITPMIWYKTITFDNGKPFVNAIIILSDIVYWYRPTEVRDECTGQFISFKKKFKSDLLQRNYQQIEDSYGLSEKQARTALIKLEEMGLIKREFRTVGQCNNVMFIRIFPEEIRKITYPESPSESEKALEQDVSGGCFPRSKQGVSLEVNRVVTSKEIGCFPESKQGVSLKGNTYTENTNTEITNKDYYTSSSSSKPENKKIPVSVLGQIKEQDRERKMEEINVKENLIKAFKEKLDYDVQMQYYQKNGSDIKLVEESKIYGEVTTILFDLLKNQKPYVSINGAYIPYQSVIEKLKGLTGDHIRYVVEQLLSCTSQIGNVKGYITAMLYNSIDTIETYYTTLVNHDTYAPDSNNKAKGSGEMTRNYDFVELEKALLSN